MKYFATCAAALTIVLCLVFGGALGTSPAGARR